MKKSTLKRKKREDDHIDPETEALKLGSAASSDRILFYKVQWDGYELWDYSSLLFRRASFVGRLQ